METMSSGWERLKEYYGLMPIKSVISVFMGLSCVSTSRPNAPKSDLRKLISLFSFFSKSKNDRTVSYLKEECNDREPGRLKCLDL